MALAFLAGYEVSEDSSLSRRSAVQESTGDDGESRFLDLGAVSQITLAAVVPALSRAEAETLFDWLVTNEAVELEVPFGTLTIRGTISPSAPIQISPNDGTQNVTFTIKGVKA